jgi:hypothetical protein
MNVFPSLRPSIRPELSLPPPADGQVDGADSGFDIDILTPTLDAAPWIGAALASVAAASRAAGVRARHVIVDGGSRDATVEIARAAGAHTIQAPGSDSHEAMNIGLAATRAAVVGFLNADDAYLDAPFGPALAILAGGTVDAVAFDCLMCDPHGAVGGVLLHADAADRAVELMFGAPGFNGHFFRRTAIERLGGFEASYRIAADRHFLLRLHASGGVCATLARVGYAYRRHARSRTLDPGATLGDAILAEHARLGRELAADPRVPEALRDLAADWQAHETSHALLRAHDWRGLLGATAHSGFAALRGARRAHAARRRLAARAHLPQAGSAEY